MTFYQFKQFSPEFQFQHVLTASTFLVHRWESEQHCVNLCHLPGGDGGRGFFAEVGYDDALVELPVLRSFSSSVPLEEYRYGVRLPEV